MSEPKRLVEMRRPAEPVELRAAELLRGAAEVEPWGELEQARLRRKLLGRLTAPPPGGHRRWNVAAVVLACVTVTVAVAVGQARGRGLAAHLTTSADAEVQWVPAQKAGENDQLNLMRGLINVRGADAQRGLAVRTPHLTAVVHASSYFVEVAGERTTLFVTEGEAWVGTVVRVRVQSGQSIRSDDPRLHPPPVPSASPIGTRVVSGSGAERPDRCRSQLGPDERFDCYLQLALGDDEIAQNALFEVGVIQSEQRHDGPSAIISWRAYLRRFPRGTLAPEAQYSILSECLTERLAPDSLREADVFLQGYPSDPRGGEVRIAAARLGCASEAQAQRGLALIEPLLNGATGAERSEALFLGATCHERLGHAVEAMKLDQDYVREFPTGPHAADLQARLSSLK